MQKQNIELNDCMLLPVPAEVMEELGLGPFSSIQMTISRGRLIVEPIDAEQSLVCFGNCRRCPGKNCCEDADL